MWIYYVCYFRPYFKFLYSFATKVACFISSFFFFFPSIIVFSCLDFLSFYKVTRLVSLHYTFVISQGLKLGITKYFLIFKLLQGQFLSKLQYNGSTNSRKRISSFSLSKWISDFCIRTRHGIISLVVVEYLCFLRTPYLLLFFSFFLRNF